MGITALPALYTLHNAAMKCRQIDRCLVDAGTGPHTQRVTFLVLTTGRPRCAPAARASFGWSRACPRSSSWPPCSRPSSRPSGGQWRLGDGWRDLGVALTMFWPSGPLVLHLPLARAEQPSARARHGHDLPVSARERVRAHPVNECGCGRGAAGAGAAERRAVVGKLRCAL